jgi:diguanylate cyclase (GGDEF)-like protein
MISGVNRLMIKVFIEQGPEQGRSLVLNANTAKIGRGLANEVHLNESAVSRVHARIFRDNDQYYIEDLKSRNGTWINGRAIPSGERVQVREGVPIAVGNVLLSLGEKCSLNRIPDACWMTIQPRVDDSLKSAAFSDRRRKPKKELELIYEVSLDLLGTLDLRELCEKVLESIFGRLKRIDSGFVFLVEPEKGKLKKIAGRFREGKQTGGSAYSRSLLRRVIKEGQAIVIPNTAIENKVDFSDSMERIGIKSVICVPLASKLGTKGAIYLQSIGVSHGFRKNDLLFLTGLSSPMALAIENALLYSKTKEAEEKLQKASDHLEKEVMNRTAELVRAKDKLEQLSITDGMSGLHNYRYLIHSLEIEFGRSIRYNRTLALLLMDIDYLKKINDTYGHLCGDYVIKTVAKVLKSNVRGTDLVARYGGDEFAVMLIETNPKSALEAVEKLRHAIGTHAFQWQKTQLSVSVSIGLTTAPGPGIQEVPDLIDAADKALYQAKKAGRNIIVVFGEGKKATAADQKSVLPRTSKQ